MDSGCVWPHASFRTQHRRAYPTWTPAALPVTEKDRNLSYTLSELIAGLPSQQIPRQAAMREAAWTRASFRAADRRGRTAPWEPVGVVISDATGNVWTPRTSFTQRKSGGAQLYFIGVPWAGESAWKLQVEFARTGGFSGAELWTVQGLRVPVIGGHTSVPTSATVNGITVGTSLFVPPQTATRRRVEERRAARYAVPHPGFGSNRQSRNRIWRSGSGKPTTDARSGYQRAGRGVPHLGACPDAY